MSARWHGSDHHPPCPGGCGELADECMTPGCGPLLGSMTIEPPIGSTDVLGVMHYTDEDAFTAVGLAIGAASVCWENPGGAGVFDSTRAAQIADELVAHLRRLRLMPEATS